MTCLGPLSSTHYCVTHDGVKYSLDDGAGAVARKTITLEPGIAVDFELDPDSTRFQQHPFYITDSNSGAGAGKHYTEPATSGTVSFTPTLEHTPLYYQCSVHTFMGSSIIITGADAAALPVPEAGTPPKPEAGTSTSSSSSGGVDASSSSSSSSGMVATDAGTAMPPSNDDGGCNSTGAGASGFGITLAFGVLAFRRRRARVAACESGPPSRR